MFVLFTDGILPSLVTIVMLIVFGFCIYGCCIWEGSCNADPKEDDHVSHLYKAPFMTDSNATIIDMKERPDSGGGYTTLINPKSSQSDSKVQLTSVYTYSENALAAQINKNVT